jgi:DNA repair protein RadC
MRLKELEEAERPREKMLTKGVEVLSNAELLAIMLRTGTGGTNAVEVARNLLQKAQWRLSAVAGMSVEKLCQTEGIGKSKAATVAAAFELGRRTAAESVVPQKISVSSPRMVYQMMLHHMRELDHEECWVIFLNRANYVLGKERISVGGMTSTVIDVKIVLRRVLDHKASGVILVHNHPSGNAIPGEADIVQTRILKNALKTCEIQLVDHVVVAEDSYNRYAAYLRQER